MRFRPAFAQIRASRVFAIALVLALALACLPRAGAQNITWVGTTSTDWNTFSNWAPFGVPPPTSSNNAIIDIATGNMPVISNANATSADLFVGYSNTSATNTSLTIQNGQTLTSADVFLGNDAGTTGTVTITGANSALIDAGTLDVGVSGVGYLTVSNGASLSSGESMISSTNINTASSVTVTGSNSIWTTSSNNFGLMIGTVGSGQLLILNGGTVILNGDVAFIGTNSGTGYVTVDGSGSSLTVDSNPIYVGDFSGTGSLTVSNGASVTLTAPGGLSPGFTNVVVGMSSSGSILVTGTGSTMTGSFKFWQGSASMTVASGGAVSANTIDNNGVITVETGGTLSIGTFDNTGTVTLQGGLLQLGGSTSAHVAGAAASGTGSFTLSGGTLQVTGSDLTSSDPITFSNGTVTTIDTNGFNATLSGAISGGGSVVKIGTGTLTFTNTNSYTGTTTVSAGKLLTGFPTAVQDSTVIENVGGGTLDFGSLFAATLGGLSGSQNQPLLNDSSNGVILLVGNDNQDTAYSGVLSGAGSLDKIGTGTLSLSGTNTYAGTTTISGGLINFSASSNFGASPGVTLSGGGLQWNNAAANPVDVSSFVSLGAGTDTLDVNGLAVTLAGALTGSGSLDVASTTAGGTLTLTASNNYSGSTTITSGTLQLSGSGTLGASTSALNANGGTLDLGGTTQSVGLTTIAGGTIQDGTLSSSATVAGQSGTVSAVLAGSNGLTENSPGGTLTLSGTNTYTGATTITAGTLQLSGSGTLGGATNALNANGGTLDLGGTTQNVGVATVAGGTIQDGTLASSATFAGQSGTISAVLAGSNGLTENGPGTLILSGTNTYTGATTITAGTLQISGTGTLGSTANALNSNGGTLDLGGTTQYAGLVTIGGGKIQNGILNSSTTFAGQSGTVSAVLAGANGLTENGPGTLTLSGSNTFTGSTTIISGILQISGGGTLGASTIAINANGGTLDLGGTTQNAGVVTIAGGTIHDGTLNSSATYAGQSGTVSAVLAGSNGLMENGPGTLTLSGTNTYTGVTSVVAGTLALGANNAIPALSAVSVSSGAVFNVNGMSDTVGSIAGAGGITLGSNGALTMGGDNASTTFSGVISGTGGSSSGLTKQGAGVLTLSGSNTYAVDTTINGGTLVVTGSAASILNTKGIDVGETITGNLMITNGGTVASSTVDVNSSSSLYSTVTVDGTNSILNLGGGFLELGVSGNGNVTISNGGNVTGSFGTIGVNGGSNGSVLVTGVNSKWNLGSSGSLNIGSSGNGNLTISNGGNVTSIFIAEIGQDSGSNGAVTVTGANSIWNLGLGVNGGVTVGNGGNGALTISNGGIVIAGGGVGVAAHQNSSVEIDGTPGSQGVLETSQVASFGSKGTFIFNGGVLQAVQDQMDLITGFQAGHLTIDSGGGFINSNGFSVTASSPISGVGGLTKLGAGSLSLAGSNSYTGGTTISAGTLQIGSGGTLGASTGAINANAGTLDLGGTTQNAGVVTIAGGTIQNGTLNSSAAYAGQSGMVSAILTGTTGLTENGPGGTLTLSGTNTYTGTTTISAGTLQISGGGTLGAATVALNANGGTLDLGATTQHVGVVTIAGGTIQNGTLNSSATFVGQSGMVNAVLAGSSGLNENGPGTLTLTKADTYTGATTINAGTLAFSGAGAGIANNGNFVVGNSVTGSLSISAGGVVTSGLGTIGNNAGSTGTALVTGANSQWNAPNNGLNIGSSGSGSLSITLGGNVTAGAEYIGLNANGNGQVVVDGANSSFNNVDGMQIGGSGTGSLTVSNGALMNIAGAELAYAAPGSHGTLLVTDPNTFLNDVLNTLGIGTAGTGAMTVANGATVTSSAITGIYNSYLGYNGGSSGTATVTGANSKWNVGATGLVVGVSGSGTLTITSGGTLSMGGVLDLAQSSSATGTLNLDSGGTLQIGGANDIQTGQGTAAVNLAGGTVQITGSDLTTSSAATLVSATTSTVNTNGFNATFSGVLSGGGALAKIGTGTMQLSGSNTYTGGTSVSAGTLAISTLGSGSATGTGVVSVAAGATLAGSGHLGGATTVLGLLLPGSSTTAGLLTFNQGLTLGGSASLDLNLGGLTLGTQYSSLDVLGNLNLSGTLTVAPINNFASPVGTIFDLYQISSGTLSGAFANINLPALGQDEVWDTSNLYTDGDIATTEPTNFPAWGASFGLSGSAALATATPFNDGLANLLRYAMNLGAALPAGDLPSPAVVNNSGTLYITLQYRQRKNMTDVQLVAQFSTDLINWTNLPAPDITQLADDDAYTARFQASVAMPNTGGMFLRVVANTIP